MPTGGGDDADRGTAPRATFFLDHDSASVRDFTEQVIAGASSPRERASLLFAAVRDRVWYDPYSVSRDPAHYRASYVLEAGRAYCVPKAVLLTAVLRAVGIPARPYGPSWVARTCSCTTGTAASTSTGDG